MNGTHTPAGYISRLQSGALSALDLVNACIAQVEKLEPEVKAFSWFDADYVRQQAEQLDQYRLSGRAIGPLHGVPVALKDIIDTQKIPTEYGSDLEKGRVPTKDAILVQRLRSAGAIIFGKTRTTELAFMDPCETRNPHNLEKTPGGSSSGSAAAVAAGMVPVAIGTQTGGSVIRPASYCGVHAIKPTFGLIPRTGVLAQSPSLDTIGIFAQSTEELALVLDVLSGYDEGDSATLSGPAPQARVICSDKPPVTPSFALVEPPFYDRASGDMKMALEELGEMLGEQVFSTTLPKAFNDASLGRETINLAEMAKCYYRFKNREEGALPPKVSEAIERGENVLARDYLAAMDWKQVINAALEEMFERCDALIIPSAPGGAPGLETTGDPVFNGIWTLCGTPVVNLPVFADSEGLPMGIQLVGPVGDDARLLRTARWLSETLSQASQSQEVA